jgi:hypothetical protein
MNRLEAFVRIFKNQKRVWFYFKSASIEGTVNSVEQKTRVFVQLMSKNSISGKGCQECCVPTTFLTEEVAAG